MVVGLFAAAGRGGVNVRVHDGVAEPADGEADLFGEDLGERGVAGEVERDAESDVAAALGEVAIEPAVLDVEDVAVMARRQLTSGGVAGFPRGNDHPAAGRFGTEGVENELDLVNFADLPVTVGVPVRMRESAPIPAVGGVEVAGFIGPSVPDFGVLPEVADMVFTGKIPEEFVEQGGPDDFLGGQ